MTCPHPTARMLGGGHCVICDGPMTLTKVAEQEAAAELAELEREAQAELEALNVEAMRVSLPEFVRGAWHVLEGGPIEWSWHHEAICQNIQALLEEWLDHRDTPSRPMRWQKLLLNICPGTLKSRITMVFAPAWMWLRCPTWQVLCVAGNPQLVVRDAEAMRDLVTSLWYRETFQVTWTIRDDIDSKSKFRNTAGGERISKGLHSKFTGIHVDCTLVDDPDDAHDVHSEAERAARSGKLQSLTTRVNDARAHVAIHMQQRVHVDDNTGDQLARGGWLWASYPLEYHENQRQDSPFFVDPRSVEGEILHPARFTPDVIAAKRLELGAFGFEAQYNQNPSPMTGGMFPRVNFRFCRIVDQATGPCKRPEGCDQSDAYVIERDARGRLDLDWMAITCDPTFGSVSETADSVGLLVVGGKGTKRFVLDDRTRRMTFTETKQAIRQLRAEYPQVDRILVEKAAGGSPIIEDLSLEFSGVIEIPVQGAKASRAWAMSPAIDAHEVYLLDGAPWVMEWIAEVSVFPNAKHDDRVDAMSQCMNYYRETTASAQLASRNAAFKAMAGRMRARFR